VLALCIWRDLKVADMERSGVEIGVTKWVRALPLDVWAGGGGLFIWL
jgi:hypothetical protein